MHRQNHTSPCRRGFTLLELLIVVALIAVLVSLGGFVLGRSITQARQSATRATLMKLDGMLQQRLEAFRMSMDSLQKQNEVKSRIATKKTQMQSAGINVIGLNEKVLQLMVYKDYYRNGFPQTLSDNPSLGSPGQPFDGNVISNPKQIAAESSEMLYWVMTQADTFGVPTVDDSEFTSAEIADTDGDGRLEFVDAWGQPLRFYRWPTRLVRPLGPAPAGGALTIEPQWRELAGILLKGLPAAPAANSGDPDPLASDPDDRLGVFLAEVTKRNPPPIINPLQFETLYHTPETYHTPLIVSGGPDKLTGLNEPNDSGPGLGRLAGPLNITPAYLTQRAYLDSEMNDNLTNRQKQN